MRQAKATGLAQRPRVTLMGMVGADHLLGTEVVDRNGNVVGHLHDILLDLRRNRIAYAAVELRKVRPDGEQIVVIPWNALFQNSDADRFTVNADREHIESAPLVPAEVTVHGLDGELATFAHSYFGTRPYWEHGSQLC